MFESKSRLDRLKAQYILGLRYETEYGLYDHNVSGVMDGRLKAVAMHPNENPITGSLREYYTDRFINLGIYKWCSLMEYFNFPYDYVESLIERSVAAAARDSDLIAKLQNEAEGKS